MNPLKHILDLKVSRSFTKSKRKRFLDGNSEAASKAVDDKDKALNAPFQLLLEHGDVEVSPDLIISKGYFGTMHKGLLKDQTVAIKTYRSSLTGSELDGVLMEIKLLASLQNHPNIIRLVGADVSRLVESRSLHVATEWAPLGNLTEYLESHLGDKQKLSLSDGVQSHKSLTLTLIRFCTQIASAMQHLERKKIIHGYLSGRQVLVFSDLEVKITGPRLSRQLYEKGIYSQRKESKRRGSLFRHDEGDTSMMQAPLPWRWAALELLKNMQNFSTMSDVWAFGVMEWEIFSLGALPYEEYPEYSVEFIAALSVGTRLTKPECATTEIHQMAMQCWNAEPSDRPSFGGLLQFFRDQIAKFDD